jgi:hypothetical protein
MEVVRAAPRLTFMDWSSIAGEGATKAKLTTDFAGIFKRKEEAWLD